MKLMIFLLLIALTACQSRQGQKQAFTNTKLIDTAWVGADGKEPVIIESLPGINTPVVMNGDTIYTNVDTPPVFSAGDLEDYVCKAVKDVHIGEAIPVVTFVVNKAGYPCYVAIRRSAKVFIPDSLIARKMDSIVCEVVRNLPYFIPAALKGKPVNYGMVVAVRFK